MNSEGRVELPANLELELPSVHVAQRSPGNAVMLLAMGALFIAGVSSPRISTAVGVGVREGVLVVAVFLGASALSFLAFYWRGARSRLYRCFDCLESFALSFAVAYLIEKSRDVHSFFWIFHGVQVLMTGVAGFSLWYVATVCVGPAYLAAAAFAHGDVAAGWLSLLAGFSGLFLYLNLARLSEERDTALRRAAELRFELGQVLVDRERTRISRDLHDSVATELTALVWSVRELSHAVPNGATQLAIEGVAERLRSVISDLRNVVLSLRGPELGFAQLAFAIRSRCRELCAACEFSLTLEGRVGDGELAAFRDEVLPICYELVQNAAAHSGASRIGLRLEAGDALRVVVSDDGRGLSENAWRESTGGLLGVRERAERLGGCVAFEARAGGTRVTLEVPRPLHRP